jgi:hypothetical protein
VFPRWRFPSTEAIRKFPPPKDVKDVARFICMVNFYQNFIRNFADVASPLNALRKKGVRAKIKRSLLIN